LDPDVAQAFVFAAIGLLNYSNEPSSSQSSAASTPIANAIEMNLQGRG
jgi:hypothetical protein